MQFLDDIIRYKKQEVEKRKKILPLEQLRNSSLYSRDTISLYNQLKESPSPGIIAEFKRRSPSKGPINKHAKISETVRAYTLAGASGISVLTDDKFFGGSLRDLEEARHNTDLPILRKDFVIDGFQIEVARSMGADVILLIAECLNKKSINDLFNHANDLGLEVLIELHAKDQLEKLPQNFNMLGINNRDLKSFQVDIETSLQIIDMVPSDKIKITESGISDSDTLNLLSNSGYHGFLIGEHFMRSKNPGHECQRFVNYLKRGR